MEGLFLLPKMMLCFSYNGRFCILEKEQYIGKAGY